MTSTDASEARSERPPGDPVATAGRPEPAEVLTLVLGGSARPPSESRRTLARAARDLTGAVRTVVAHVSGEPETTQSSWEATHGYERAWGALSEADCDAVLDEYQNAFRWLRRNDLVSIAVLRGSIAGLGLHAALACDLRFLASDATLAWTETAAGLVPALTGTGPLVELVGVDRALELCLSGRKIDARESEELGLVTRVVPTADLQDVVDTFVTGLLALPRDAVAETKALLSGASGRRRSEQEAAERAALGRRLRDLTGNGE